MMLVRCGWTLQVKDLPLTVLDLPLRTRSTYAFRHETDSILTYAFRHETDSILTYAFRHETDSILTYKMITITC